MRNNILLYAAALIYVTQLLSVIILFLMDVSCGYRDTRLVFNSKSELFKNLIPLFFLYYNYNSFVVVWFKKIKTHLKQLL